MRKEKVPVEKLQEEHLVGPADQSVDKIAEELNVDGIVAVSTLPPMETIVFRNQRDPGYPLEFHYSSKTCPFKMYKLIDGHTYTLPREVVMNLQSCKEDIHKYRKNAEGLPEIYCAGYKTHFVCERVG